MQIDNAFKAMLDQLDLETIRTSRDTTYIIDPQFRLRAFNDAWVDFALRNGGAALLATYPLGAYLPSAFPDDLEVFYRSAYADALASRTVFEHDYECSSAQTYRRFHQTAYPLPASAGLVISNHKIESGPHPEPGVPFGPDYLDAHGHLVQCAHCRKVRDPSDPATWVWIPAILDRPVANVSHSLCPRCLDFYYPKTD